VQKVVFISVLLKFVMQTVVFILVLLCGGSRVHSCVAESFCSAGSCVYSCVAETLLCRKLCLFLCF